MRGCTQRQPLGPHRGTVAFAFTSLALREKYCIPKPAGARC